MFINIMLVTADETKKKELRVKAVIHSIQEYVIIINIKYANALII